MTYLKIRTGAITCIGMLAITLGCLAPLTTTAAQGLAMSGGKDTLAAKNQCRVLRHYGDNRFNQGREITCGAFSPKSRYLAVGTRGSMTTAWDLNGKRLADLKLHSTGLGFSPDGTVLYVLAVDGKLHAIETANWTPKWSLAVSAGHGAAMSLNDGKACVLDPTHGVTVVDLTKPTVEKTRAVGKFVKGSLSPDGTLIALYTGDRGKRQVSIQETVSGRVLRTLDHNPPEGQVALALSRDNKSLALSGDDGLAVIDLATGNRRELAKASSPRPLHSPPRNGKRAYYLHKNFTRLAFSNGGRLLTGATTTDLLYTFRLNGKVSNKPSIFRDIKGVVFSPDDAKALILGSGLSGQVRLCKMPSAKPLFTRHGAYGSGRVYFSPDRSYFVMLCENYTVRVFTAATGKVTASLRHNHPINQIVFTPDGKRMIAGDNLSKVVVWQTGSWKAEQVIADHGNCVTAVALSPDKKTLYTGDRKGVLIVRDLATLKKKASLQISSKRNPEIWAVTVSEDHILLGTNAAMVEVFDRKTNQPVEILAAKSHPSDGGVYYIRATAHSPEAKTYCAISHDGILYVWDSRTLKLLKTIDCGGALGTHGVAYAPGGQYIVVTCRDKGMRIYDPSTGEQVFRFADIAVGNVGDMHWKDGKLVMTLATQGYTAQQIAVFPAPVDAADPD